MVSLRIYWCPKAVHSIGYCIYELKKISNWDFYYSGVVSEKIHSGKLCGKNMLFSSRVARANTTIKVWWIQSKVILQISNIFQVFILIINEARWVYWIIYKKLCYLTSSSLNLKSSWPQGLSPTSDDLIDGKLSVSLLAHKISVFKINY